MRRSIKKLSDGELLNEYLNAHTSCGFNDYDDKSTKYFIKVETEVLKRMEADNTWNFIKSRN
jgi:hypothetical protein